MPPTILIPAYNPDRRLLELVNKLSPLQMPIVVVDDGSKPSSQTIFDQLEAESLAILCRHDQNKGKGAALKTGMAYILEHFPGSVGCITADADGQHSPEDIGNIAQQLIRHPDSLILGVRNFSGKDIPYKSRWGNWITSLVFFFSTGHHCPDTQTGLRGIPSHLAKAILEVPGDRFEYEMNVLLKAAADNVPFVYQPIQTIYLDENISTHFHPVRDSFVIYKNIIKYSFSSLFSSLVDIGVFTALMYGFLERTSNGILIATVTARLMSGAVNFMVNKQWVFENKDSNVIKGIEYLVLFCFIMFSSWFLVNLFSRLPISITIIKIVVDSGLFLLSYFIQKKFIFRIKI